jgi:hypothetical protein
MPAHNRVVGHILISLLAAVLLAPGILIGCSDDSTNRAPGDNYGSANYKNDPTIDNTTDPGSVRAMDRGIPQSATTGGARDGGLGYGVSGGSPAGR